MNFKAIINEFKSQVAFTLLLIWLLAIWHFQSLNSILYPLLAVALMTTLDLGWAYLKSKKIYWPSASFVTGFLIGLIIDPSESIWIIFGACLLASFSKQFIKTGVRQHIFNPAAFGIMVTSLILGVPVAWWGVAWGKLPLVILIPLMARILWRMKRLFLPLGFLVTYSLYLIVAKSDAFAYQAIFDSSTLLFAVVMLPEPITSPNVGKFKYLFGMLVALVAIAFSPFEFLVDAYLPALLVSNLVAFLLARSKIIS